MLKQELRTQFSAKRKELDSQFVKIESLKMGGLLAVNKGSLDEPTFTILEWKPEGATNDKPIVFVNSGSVYPLIFSKTDMPEELKNNRALKTG